MQKVVWITKQHWLKPGTMTYMGLLNARAFAESGVPTHFFVSADKDYDVAKGEEDLAGFYGLPSHPLFTIHWVPEAKSWRRQVYDVARAKLFELCGDGGEIIAVTRDYGALANLLALKKRLPNLKVIYESHNFFINTRHLGQASFSLSNLRLSWVERHQLPNADGLICLTEHQRALYQHWLTKLPAIALPLGCLSFPPFHDVDQRRLQRCVVYIGHLFDFKGLDLFFQIARHLQGADVRLRIIGGFSDQVAKLQQRAGQEGLRAVLQFQPFVEPTVLHDILDAEVSIGIAPLQDTFYNRYLTCPVKVLDFLSHGLPVVASDLPSIRDVAREAGFYCESQQAAQFAEKIISLLDHQEAYIRATQLAYGRSGELCWQNRAKRLLGFTESLTIQPHSQISSNH